MTLGVSVTLHYRDEVSFAEYGEEVFQKLRQYISGKTIANLFPKFISKPIGNNL